MRLAHVRPALDSILVVDDEPDILDSMLDLLRAHLPGAALHAAPNGQAALAFLHRNPVSLVISDHRMPGITGLEFLTECRRLWPDSPRILITAYPEADLARRALAQADIHSFLTKPIAPSQLLQAVNAAAVKGRVRA